jgi:hypothetical protein
VKVPQRNKGILMRGGSLNKKYILNFPGYRGSTREM